MHLWQRAVNQQTKQRTSKKAEVRKSTIDKIENTQSQQTSTKQREFPLGVVIHKLNQGIPAFANKCTAAAKALGIVDNIANADDHVKSSLVILSGIHKVIGEGKPLRGGKRLIVTRNLLGTFASTDLMRCENNVSNSVYWYSKDKTIRVSMHSAVSENFKKLDNLSIVIKKGHTVNNLIMIIPIGSFLPAPLKSF